MRISIVIPAHNEAAYLEACLNAFVAQTHGPDEVIIIDDNSSDRTFEIASAFAKKHAWIKTYQRRSTDKHLPGQKVVEAFNLGLEKTSDHYLIGKFDADIVLPSNYFETMRHQFQTNTKLGVCGGLLYVKKNNSWVYETIAKKDHVRGPIKLYRKTCLEAMGGLRLGTGWDTVDVLLAQYHGFQVQTVGDLTVKHLRPTGYGYHSKNYSTKGEALFKMRYGLILTKLALYKMAWQAKTPRVYLQGIFGYLHAIIHSSPRFVTPEEGRFIRRLRWKGILNSFR